MRSTSVLNFSFAQAGLPAISSSRTSSIASRRSAAVGGGRRLFATDMELSQIDADFQLADDLVPLLEVSDRFDGLVGAYGHGSLGVDGEHLVVAGCTVGVVDVCTQHTEHHEADECHDAEEPAGQDDVPLALRLLRYSVAG